MARRILVINPNTSSSMTDEIRKSAEAVKLFDTELTFLCPDQGPETIETHLDEALSAIGVLSLIAARREAFDAFVIACGDDPGLKAAREVTDRPVVPIGQAPMLLAPLLGRKFSILGTWSGDKARSEDKVARYGLAGLLASVIPSGESVLCSHRNPEALLERLTALGRKAVEEDGAEVLILTCAGLAGLHRELQERLGVPVLEGIACAVRLAELLVDLGLRTSRRNEYQRLPNPKKLLGFGAFNGLDCFK
jgi:allantoin racemase